jgi:hypothetical protein
MPVEGVTIDVSPPELVFTESKAELRSDHMAKAEWREGGAGLQLFFILIFLINI